MTHFNTLNQGNNYSNTSASPMPPPPPGHYTSRTQVYPALTELQQAGQYLNDMRQGRVPYNQQQKDYAQGMVNVLSFNLLDKMAGDLYQNLNTQHLNLQA